jgi:hypothetical protein
LLIGEFQPKLTFRSIIGKEFINKVAKEDKRKTKNSSRMLLRDFSQKGLPKYAV